MWVWIYLWAPRTTPTASTPARSPTTPRRCARPIEAEIERPTAHDHRHHDHRVGAITWRRRSPSPRGDGRGPERSRESHLTKRPQAPRSWFADRTPTSATRQAYAERLRAAPADAERSDLAFTLTERSSGGIYTRTIDGFAEVNDMTSCVAPHDICNRTSRPERGRTLAASCGRAPSSTPSAERSSAVTRADPPTPSDRRPRRRGPAPRRGTGTS